MAEGIKKRRVILILTLSIVTFGIYAAIWFMRVKKSIDALGTEKKLKMWMTVTFLVAVLLDMALLAYTVITPPFLISESVILLRHVLLVVNVAMVLNLSLQTEKALDEYFNRTQNRNIKMSLVPTFFFTLLYLQHKINQFVSSAPAKVQPPQTQAYAGQEATSTTAGDTDSGAEGA
ncbi:DUF4234 domain-containing protein [Candidatus Woesearchaeota archaeon]|nr:DUF4234 domain-containing protein [Candidatus Woesearchaeota archaeon]